MSFESTVQQAIKSQKCFPIVVFVFAILLYANTFGHMYAIDDNLVIYGNEYTEKGLGSTKYFFTKPYTYGSSKINDSGYRPFTLLTFALELELFGKNPFYVQHVIQVTIYAITAFFLFLFLRRLFHGQSQLIPFVAVILWIAHPVHTEVVANLKSRDEMLALLFGLVLPMLLVVKYLDTKKILYFVLATFFYTIGIFSKENTITLLVHLPLVLFFFEKSRFKKICIYMVPFAVITVGFLLIRGHYLGLIPEPKHDLIQNILLGAKSWDERYATAMLVLLKYLGLLFIPHPLVWDYSYNQIPLTNFSDIRVLYSLFIYGAMFVFAIVKFRSRNIFSYCILFYLVGMSINSNLFVMTNCTMGERFLYTPSLGFCIAFAAMLAWIFRVESSEEWDFQNIKRMMIAVLIVLLPFTIKTFVRNFAWKDSLTVSLADINTSKESVRVQSTLAGVYLALAKKDENKIYRRQLYQQIIPLAEKILEIYPEHKEATYNLGICYFFLQEYEKAEESFFKHLKLHPDDYKTYNNIAGLYYFRQDYKTALEWFKKFVAKNPDDEKAVNNLGTVTLRNLNDPKNAIPYFERAINIKKDYADPYEGIGDAYVMLKEPLKAVDYYKKAADLNPLKQQLLNQRIAQIMMAAQQSGAGN